MSIVTQPEHGSKLTVNQYLTFSLDCQEFAIEILQVQEIRNFTKITPIPNSREEVRGVINLRGSVVPVVDLRSALGLPCGEDLKFAVIIVANIGTTVVGLIVDSVSDVIDVPPEDIELPPNLVTKSNESQTIQGIAKSDERLISLLNLENLIHVDSESLVTAP